MASAGRILIIPKGDYNAETEYEMLDLVKHNGTSWLAKKTCKGIEPSEANAEYWHKFVDLDWDADSIGAIKRSGYQYYDGNVDELKVAGTYHVVTPNDKVTGTLPMPDGYWYTINVFADGTGSVVQIWVVATASGTPSRIFIRHFGGSTWYPYFEVVNAYNGKFASDVTIQKADNGKSVILKNHSESADIGTTIEDYDAEDNKLSFSLSAKNSIADCIGITKNNGDYLRLFGEHNPDMLLNLLAPHLGGTKIATGQFTGGKSTSGQDITFEFAPKLVVILGMANGETSNTSITLLMPSAGVGTTVVWTTETTMGMADVTLNGNTAHLAYTGTTNFGRYYECRADGLNYYYVAIG